MEAQTREQTYAHQLGKVGGGGKHWEVGIDTCMLLILVVRWITNENILNSSENSTQCSFPKWEGNPKERGCVYTYKQFTLLHGRH